MKLKFFCALIVTIFSFNALSVADELKSKPLRDSEPEHSKGFIDGRNVPDKPMHLPEKMTSIEEKSTQIIIRSNVSGADVFLNGNFWGKTELVLNNLKPGTYRLKVQKKNYEPKEMTIKIKSGESQSFYITLEKYSGLVMFYSEPSGANFFVDGHQVFGNPVKVEEGVRTVKASLFGYLIQEKKISVFRNSQQEVKFTLEKAPFEITRFSASRKSFNPKGWLWWGFCRFKFSVTSDASGSLKIMNEKGDVVQQYDFSHFSKWDHSIKWNGKDFNRKDVAKGIYTARLELNDKVAETTIKIR